MQRDFNDLETLSDNELTALIEPLETNTRGSFAMQDTDVTTITTEVSRLLADSPLTLRLGNLLARSARLSTLAEASQALDIGKILASDHNTPENRLVERLAYSKLASTLINKPLAKSLGEELVANVARSELATRLIEVPFSNHLLAKGLANELAQSALLLHLAYDIPPKASIASVFTERFVHVPHNVSAQSLTDRSLAEGLAESLRETPFGTDVAGSTFATTLAEDRPNMDEFISMTIPAVLASAWLVLAVSAAAVEILAVAMILRESP